MVKEGLEFSTRNMSNVKTFCLSSKVKASGGICIIFGMFPGTLISPNCIWTSLLIKFVPSRPQFIHTQHDNVRWQLASLSAFSWFSLLQERWKASCKNYDQMNFLNCIPLVSLKETEEKEAPTMIGYKNTALADRLLNHVCSPPLVVHFLSDKVKRTMRLSDEKLLRYAAPANPIKAWKWERAGADQRKSWD